MIKLIFLTVNFRKIDWLATLALVELVSGDKLLCEDTQKNLFLMCHKVFFCWIEYRLCCHIFLKIDNIKLNKLTLLTNKIKTI